MKRILLPVFVMLSILAYGQRTIQGIVLDEAQDPAIGATILIKGTSTGTATDFDGNFSIEAPEEALTLLISYVGMEDKSVKVAGGGDINLGNVAMKSAALGLEEVVVTGVMDIVRDRNTPVAVSTVSISEIQAKGVGNVEFPETMKNTPSVYVSSQTGFGDSQMFLRGFDQTNTAFLLNGQPINGMEDGKMYWSNWSGMSDVANAVQIQRGLGSSKLAISSVGGTINIVTKTVQNKKGGYGRLMVGNDGYLKGTVAYNTGLKDKWAFSMLLDHWQADRKWADGTRGQGQNYFFSVGYQPNDKHTFNFLVTGAPQWHGQRWSQSEEKLEEEPRFNQHWGSDQGEWESERRNFYHKPVINLSWDYEINEKSKLASVLYASFGRGGGTGPFGSSSNRIRTEGGQVDFEGIRAANKADMDGIGSFSDNYAIRSSMNNHQWFGNVTNFETSLSDNITWSVGADFRWYQGDHFRQFANLLGLEGWEDTFRHATRPDGYTVTKQFNPNPWTALFNFADESERIAYDYSEDINYQGTFTQFEFTNDLLSAYVQGAVSNQSYQRDGRWADIGKSEKINKIGYNIKGGAAFNVGANSTIFGNTGYYSRQPFLDNIFENIRYSNELVSPDVENEEVLGFEAGYKYEGRDFLANVNVYSTTWENRTLSNVFVNENGTPDDDSDDFNQLNVQRGIGQVHTGIEGDFQYRMDRLRLRGYTSIGNWTYSNIDRVTFFNDDTGVQIGEETAGEDLDIDGVHVPNAPQFSFGLGVKYEVAKGLDLELDYNYFDNLWRRDNFDSGDVVLREDIGKLPAYGLVDLSAAYRFTIGDTDMILRGNIYNLLDNDYLNQTDPFGVINGNGLTWNTSLKVLF